MDGIRNQANVVCRQCKKEIKTEAWKCVPCVKLFHPSCQKIHKVYNSQSELIPCKGKIEIIQVNVTKDSSKELQSSFEGSQVPGSSMDKKIDTLYLLVKEIKNEIIGKNLIKNAIKEAIDEEMVRIRHEIQTWKEIELELLISKVMRKEVRKMEDILPVMSQSDSGRKKTFKEAVTREQEAVIIIKPKGEDAGSSEVTKKDIKNKIDVSKLGVGITKMKKVTRGAVVVGCENKMQVEKLKEKVAKDLGEKYVIQVPMKRKLKIRIFDVEKEDSENEQEFWEKIREQNGFRKDSVHGKILHKSRKEGSQRTTIIAEVDSETHRKMLEEEKIKIGWKICTVQNYIGILRCFKCCGYYHFAKDCNKEEICGICAGRHATKGCKGEINKCVNCEEKVRVFKIKNLNLSHSAFDTDCPCYKRELEKQKSRIHSSL